MEATDTQGLSKRRRGPEYITFNACVECRRKKTKGSLCDGSEPCTRCAAKGTECLYQTSLRISKEKLREEITDLKAQLQQSEAGFHESSASQAPKVHSARYAATIVPESAEATGRPLERSNVSTTAVMSPAARASGAETTSQLRIVALRTGCDAFYRCTGLLFYVYTKEELGTLQQNVLQHLSASGWLECNNQGVESSVVVSFAEMCGMAAVGLQYTTEPIPGMGYSGSKADGTYEFAVDFYQIAKQLVDEAIGSDPLRAMKLCTLLSMYNIIEHSSVALAYAEMGISLGENHGQQHGIHVVGRPGDESADHRRVLRTLITLRSWLITTLGFLPVDESALRFTNGLAFKADDMRIEDIIQTEMARVTIIKSRFMQTADNLRKPSPLLLRSVREDLARWYSQLPEWMTLSHLAERSSEVSGDHRRVIYFVHLFHLSAIILKSRIVHGAQETNHVAYDSMEMRIAIRDGIESSRSSARILKLLQEADTVFKKCWLCIFQAYMSGISLLYAVTRRLQGDCVSSSWRDDVVLAGYCLDTLEFCATADSIAEKFCETLKDALVEISAFTNQGHGCTLDPEQSLTADGVDLSLEHIYNPLQEGSALYDTSCRLLDILRQPFAALTQAPISETMTNVEETSVGAHLDWRVEVSSPFDGQSEYKGPGEVTSRRVGAETIRYLQSSWYPITSDPYGWRKD